jgi:aspartate kinase
MAEQTGVAQKMFRALANSGVNIQMITTSEIKISVLVSRDQGIQALRVLHGAFELDKPPTTVADARVKSHRPADDTSAVVARLQDMEGLTVSDAELDASQASVTISGVPDTPGVAAQVFEQIAAAGIFVDMIVQSYGRQGHANLSFTVPRTALAKAVDAATKLAQQFGCGPVTQSPAVSKLSVSGIGMRSHTSVAIRMFQALGSAGINLEMINTSEVRVNVVVRGDKGEAGLKALQDVFADCRV